jgi:nucleoside 2-deoxyribosyltransferase
LIPRVIRETFMHTIYVAGPVLRPELLQQASAVPSLYEHLALTAARSDVAVRLPIFDKELDTLGPRDFAAAIWQQIRDADSLLALLDVPGVEPQSNLSVAGEAHWAAAFGKPVAIVASAPERVPRLIRALSLFEIYSWQQLDFARLFLDLRSAPTPPR